MDGSKAIATAYLLTKTLGLGLIAFAVINNSALSPLVRAIIVAMVSGILGIVGIVLGARINASNNRDILEKAIENHELAEQNRVLLDEIRELTGKTQKIVERRSSPR